MGRRAAACICGLSLWALGCGVTPEDLWQLGAGNHHQPPEPPRAIDDRIDQACLREQLTPFVESVGAGWPEAYQPTGTVLVSASGQALYARGFGASDLEQGSANTARTSFRVGSITKGFTAVGILRLVEAGLLQLDGTIGEYLPEYPALGAGITLHQLLSHTAGLPNYTDNAELMARRDQPMSPEELLASFWELPLLFEPGTQFSYSNSNYIVLGAIIERVTGQSYATYMQRAVLGPAGLTRTTVGDAAGLPDRARGYASDLFGNLVPAFPIDMSVPFAAGAIRSTALDLVRWNEVLESDRLLDAHSRELLTTPVLNGYAYGWAISEQNGLKVVEHNGGIDGFRSDFIRVPELDLAVVVLLNSTSLQPEIVSSAALRCALGEDIPPQPPAPVAPLDAEQRAKLIGTYRISEQARQLLQSQGFTEDDIATLATVDVYEEQGALLFEPVGQGPVLMLPTSEADAVLPDVDATLHFSFGEGADLPATALALEQGGVYLFER
jgi:CubicO group peptidase (beta-lactamase class C family)